MIIIATNHFNGQLRKLRKRQGLTLVALAKLTGFSHSYLSQLERGERGNEGIPSPEVLKKLADGLSVDYLELMRLAGHMHIKKEEITIDEVIVGMPSGFLIDYLELKNKQIGQRSFELSSFGEFFKAENDIGLILQGLRCFRRMSLDELSDKTKININDLKSFENSYETPTNDELLTIGQGLEITNLPVWLSIEFGIQLDINESLDLLLKSRTTIEIDLWDIDIDMAPSGKVIVKKLSNEMLKKRLFSLDYLLKQDHSELFFKNKVFSESEKQRAYKILEAAFMELPEESNKDFYKRKIYEKSYE